MTKKPEQKRSKVGLPPGSLVHVGQQKTEEVTFHLIDYDPDGMFLEHQTDDLAELAAAIETPSITWINVIGLHQVDRIEEVGAAFGLHTLLLEDILNTDQRPKLDQFEKYLCLILKMLFWDEAAGAVVTEQLSLVLGQTYVLTFQEQEKDVFGPLRQRLREGQGRIRAAGADYLAYAILDSLVDNYFLVLEQLGDQIEDVEEELVVAPTSDTLTTIYHLKRQLLFMRKSVWPLREALSMLLHDGGDLIRPATLIYLRDVYEHTIHTIDTVETLRDIVAGILDIYLSSVSNKMNEVMKLLTVITTLFIPLTFVTSLYGMNFHYMPELAWRWGYGFVWLVMLLMTGGMLYYFRRKEWL